MTESIPPGLPLDADGRWHGVIDDPGLKYKCGDCGAVWKGVHECEAPAPAPTPPSRYKFCDHGGCDREVTLTAVYCIYHLGWHDALVSVGAER